MGFFDKLREGLGKTKQTLNEKINDVFANFRKVDEDLLDELEEALIMSDIGIETSTKIINELRIRIKKENIQDEEAVRRVLKEEMIKLLDVGDTALDLATVPSVILVVGVNGVGKTTSIGKIANNLKKSGKKVVIAAADTFRAAAVEQIEIWAQRTDCELVKKPEGSDPASVVFDAIQVAKEQQADVLICDTAGRLHNKKNLMDELEKMNRVLDKNLQNIDKNVIMVLDATTGQNGVSQINSFFKSTDVDGIILTKLDSTAKGGVVFSIVSELSIPILYVGTGEQISDIEQFNIEDFVEAII